MKTSLTVLLAFAVFYSGFRAQIPTNGLVGAWPFSGSAMDGSGTGNHGTVSGASLTTDRCGNANSAYHFNGNSDYIQMLMPGPTGTVSRSISFWARTNNQTINKPVASFDYGLNSGNGDGFQIVWNYCGKGAGLDVSNQAFITGDTCLLNNGWHHIVAVYNSTLSNIYGNVVFYVDGQAKPITCNVSGTTAVINTSASFPVTIGRHAFGPARYFNGDLDDFYLYNRPLSHAEVLQLYNDCSPAVSGNTLVCPGSVHTYSVHPFAGNVNYQWTLPSGWTGSSLTNTISVTAGMQPGNINVAAAPGSCSGPAATGLGVNVQGLNVTANTTNDVICYNYGQTATLTAGGATSYTWQPGGIMSQSFILTPSPSLALVYSFTVTGADQSGCTGTKVVSVLSTICGGMEDSGFNGINPPGIYPNPSSGIYSIVSPEQLSYKVFNCTGKEVLSGQVVNDRNTIDLQNFPRGIYMIRLASEKREYSRRLFLD